MIDSSAVKHAVSEIGVVVIVVGFMALCFGSCAIYSARNCQYACSPNAVRVCGWAHVECERGPGQ